MIAVRKSLLVDQYMMGGPAPVAHQPSAGFDVQARDRHRRRTVGLTPDPLQLAHN